jgi:hypothetical protein
MRVGARRGRWCRCSDYLRDLGVVPAEVNTAEPDPFDELLAR